MTSKTPTRQTPRRDQLEALLANAPAHGLKPAELSEAMGIKHPCVKTLLQVMLKEGRVFVIKAGRITRYFPTAEALEIGKVLFDIERQQTILRRKEKQAAHQRKYYANKVAQGIKRKYVKPATKKVRPKKVKVPKLGKDLVAKPRPKAPEKIRFHDLPAQGMDKVKVQVIPGFSADRAERFTPKAPIVGGFMSDWAARRGVQLESRE